MGVIWTSYGNREEWLHHRDGIGASEAGAVCGMGFRSPLELWKEKLGIDRAPDLSDNNRVQFGNDIEEPLRALFRVMHPQYRLDFTPFTILRRDDRHTFMFSTPDGWLTDIAGRKGLYESKSATCISAADWQKWKDKVPDGYYCQLMHSMYVGNFEYAVLFAILRTRDNDAEIRTYHFERDECEADIAWLVEKETHFWEHNVKKGIMPAAPLKL